MTTEPEPQVIPEPEPQVIPEPEPEPETEPSHGGAEGDAPEENGGA